jgi:hypothetical protein
LDQKAVYFLAQEHNGITIFAGYWLQKPLKLRYLEKESSQKEEYKDELASHFFLK